MNYYTHTDNRIYDYSNIDKKRISGVVDALGREKPIKAKMEALRSYDLFTGHLALFSAKPELHFCIQLVRHNWLGQVI